MHWALRQAVFGLHFAAHGPTSALLGDPKRDSPTRKTRAHRLGRILQKLRRTVSFVFGDVLLPEEFLEERLRRLSCAPSHAFETPLDTLDGLESVLGFHEFLIAAGVLNDELGFAINSQYYGGFGLLHLANELRGVTFECTKTLNVSLEFQ